VTDKWWHEKTVRKGHWFKEPEISTEYRCNECENPITPDLDNSDLMVQIGENYCWGCGHGDTFEKGQKRAATKADCDAIKRSREKSDKQKEEKAHFIRQFVIKNFSFHGTDAVAKAELAWTYIIENENKE